MSETPRPVAGSCAGDLPSCPSAPVYLTRHAWAWHDDRVPCAWCKRHSRWGVWVPELDGVHLCLPCHLEYRHALDTRP